MIKVILQMNSIIKSQINRHNLSTTRDGVIKYRSVKYTNAGNAMAASGINVDCLELMMSMTKLEVQLEDNNSWHFVFDNTS